MFIQLLHTQVELCRQFKVGADLERGNTLQHTCKRALPQVFVEQVGNHESQAIANSTTTVLHLEAYLGIQHVHTHSHAEHHFEATEPSLSDALHVGGEDVVHLPQHPVIKLLIICEEIHLGATGVFFVAYVSRAVILLRLFSHVADCL